MKITVIPSLKAKENLQQEAKAWADACGFAYAPRQKQTVAALREKYGDCFLIYSSKGPQIDSETGSHYFSLNMAQLRIQNICKGQGDHLLEALMGGETTPLSLLDCTCGLGADSLVASFGLPAGSRINALEISPQLAAVTGWGFQHFVHPKAEVTAALRRIILWQKDYRAYLKDPAAPHYDVLYFDPMFRFHVAKSQQFSPLAGLIDDEPLSLAAVHLALGKAKKRVVIKERGFRWLLKEFPQAVICGGKYSRVHYAVLEV